MEGVPKAFGILDCVDIVLAQRVQIFERITRPITYIRRIAIGSVCMQGLESPEGGI
jgi:hypothetical protein